MIHAYEQKGGKLEINNPYTLNGKTTSNWDYHVASLVMLQDQSNKELYIAVIDNFFSKFPMTLNEWFKLFSPNQIIKYRLVPFIRSEDREHKYMAYEKAKSEAEKTKRTPPKFY
jgi:hypothetical protein